MAGSKTQYLAKAILDHCLGGNQFTPPTQLWFVLSGQAFSPTATGAACNELTNTDYGRIEVTNDATTWSPASDASPSVKSNINDIPWATATEDWPETPTSIYVADAATLGNLLYGADLFNPQAVATGDVFKVLAGTFVFSED